MSAPVEEPAELIGVGTQAVVEGAQRLGLTWDLKLATITQIITTGSTKAIMARYDGDDTGINMVDMTSHGLVKGDRVYGMAVPPAGNFIVGVAGISPPLARLRRSTNQSIPNNVFTEIIFTVEDYDTADGHDLNVNPDRYTAQAAGRYLVCYHAAFAASAIGIRAMRLGVNGAVVPASNCLDPSPGAAAGTHYTGSTTIQLNFNDYVTFQVYQNSGGNLDQEISGDSGPVMDIMFIGPIAS
jgi:hypothetical protein